MTERAVSITEAKTRLSSLITRVADSHERVILRSHGRPKAALIGLDDLAALRSGGPSSRLTAMRAEGLERIRALSRVIKKASRRRHLGDSVEDLAALRRGRDARLGRLRRAVHRQVGWLRFLR